MVRRSDGRRRQYRGVEESCGVAGPRQRAEARGGRRCRGATADDV
ncbi:hypothetical protein ACP70R_042148 [Stipagrostis hirtigluma subsp. patula]